MGRLVVDDEGVSVGAVGPGSGGRGGVEVGFGSGDVGATALDLRLEPNPRPFSREFRELIRRDGAARGEGSTATATTAARRRSRRGIWLYYMLDTRWRREETVAVASGALVSIDSTGMDPGRLVWLARAGGRLGTQEPRAGWRPLVERVARAWVSTSGGGRRRSDGLGGRRVSAWEDRSVWNRRGRGREGEGERG